MSVENPCITCGACCAYFRISYYWGEDVPEGYYQETTPMYRSMKKTEDEKGNIRCIALKGEVGSTVGCSIYENRPSPCRNFRFSYDDGVTSEPRCDQARAKFGMPPLQAPVRTT